MKHTTLEIDPMREAAAEATALLHNLANVNRLLLLCQLTQGEKSVGELEALLDIRQPTLSQQLGVLRSDGLVANRRDGKQVYYSIADDRVRVILTMIYKLYCPAK